MTDPVTFAMFIQMLVGGAAAPFVYWCLAKWEWYQRTLQADVKRWIAFGCVALIAVLAWIVGVAFSIYPAPGPGWQGWVVAIMEVILALGTGFTGSTLIHTKDLKAKAA